MQPVTALKAEISQIFALELWAERGLLIAVGNDQRVQLFDPRVPAGHPRFVRLANTNYLAVTAQENPKTAGYRQLLQSAGGNAQQPERATGVCFFGCGEGLVEAWDLREPSKRLAGAKLFSSDVRVLELDPSGGYLLGAALGRDCAIVRASTLQRAVQLPWQRERVFTAEWHPFFPLVAGATDQGARLAHSTLFNLPQSAD